jgi:hypothetical protein
MILTEISWVMWLISGQSIERFPIKAICLKYLIDITWQQKHGKWRNPDQSVVDENPEDMLGIADCPREGNEPQEVSEEVDQASPRRIPLKKFS